MQVACYSPSQLHGVLLFEVPMGRKIGIVFGVGINDVGRVSNNKNGANYRCPFYARWHSMITRCYSEKFQYKNPSYIGCSVCDEWLTFSNFKRWMEQQDWHGKDLDKDILVKGNRVYSPETCMFVDRKTNISVRCRPMKKEFRRSGVEPEIPGADGLKQVNDLIKQYGTQQKLADAMGVSQSQVARWVRIGAFVNVYLGEVYILTRKVNPL